MTGDRSDQRGERDDWPGLERFDAALAAAREQVDANLERFDGSFPGPASEGGEYPLTDCQSGWTPAFWTGQLWLLYDLTGGRRYRDAAEAQVERFARRLHEGNNVRTHDLGFLYHLSAVPAAVLRDDDAARDVAVEAADRLAGRYHEVPGVVQAWGDPDDPTAQWPEEWGHGRVIVDTMMNLPLLFWASRETGRRDLRRVAVSHAVATADHLVREDGSTFHTYRFDVETGEPLDGETHQGAAADSCWARGQAWTIYGMALAYRYTGHERFRDCAADMIEYYLDEVPDDLIPCWDLDFDPADGEERDTSAAAIAACGLLALRERLPAAAEARRRYERVALDTLATLAADYTDDGVEGLLAEGVYNKPGGAGVGESTIWGDYFYLEGLTRAARGLDPYW